MRSICRWFDPRGRTLALLLVSAVAISGAACGKNSEKQLAATSLNKGLKEHAAGHLENAAKAYREVLVHEPNNKFAYYNLGLIEQQNGRNQSAEGNYRQALAVDPDFVPALFNLAIILTNDRHEEAVTVYRRVIELKPDDAGAHLNLGFLLISLGRSDEGNAELDKAIDLDASLEGRRQSQSSPDPGAQEPKPSPAKGS
jgi:tetratricopeptide (TPR) repeat protein